jgi:mannose-6-phosphate isomerase-like protein (cupin superfamily)
MISKQNAPSFTWREVCDGWTLLDAADLHLLQERMPAGTSELLHSHGRVRQVYFVLAGEATVDLDGYSESLRAGEALVIEPLTPHRISNRSTDDLEFLVISSSPPRLDRENLE